jgi:hypothetical protein
MDSDAPSTDVSPGTGGVPMSTAPSGHVVTADSTQPGVFPSGTLTASGQPVEFTGAAHRGSAGVQGCLLTMLAGMALLHL